jgi:hypothetical protein
LRQTEANRGKCVTAFVLEVNADRPVFSRPHLYKGGKEGILGTTQGVNKRAKSGNQDGKGWKEWEHVYRVTVVG